MVCVFYRIYVLMQNLHYATCLPCKYGIQREHASLTTYSNKFTIVVIYAVIDDLFVDLVSRVIFNIYVMLFHDHLRACLHVDIQSLLVRQEQSDINLYHAELLHVDISTGGSIRCTLQWISQQPVMIEQCFNFSNTLPGDDESVCIIRIYLN